MMKAIVTGHTRGLGAALARELLARSVPVMGLSRHANQELAQQFPHLLQQTAIDLAAPAAIEQWLSENALDRFIDGAQSIVLINNAGTVQPVGPLTMQQASSVARAINLNVTAPMMLSAALAAAGSNKNEVRILHISSGAGRSAYAGWSVYCATKAALDQHARAVALDGLAHVRICSLAPGVVDTDMQAEIRATSLERFPLRERFDELKRSGELSSPADCATRVIDFLLNAQFGKTPVADLRDALR